MFKETIKMSLANGSCKKYQRSKGQSQYKPKRMHDSPLQKDLLG